MSAAIAQSEPQSLILPGLVALLREAADAAGAFVHEALRK